MTIYINKNNVVVYVAPTKEDEITPNSKGKLLFTTGEYNPETMKYSHILGKGEEVRAIEDASGLAIGDEYIEPIIQIVEPTIAEKISQVNAEIEALEDDLADKYNREKTKKDSEFIEWVKKQAQEITNE